MDHSPTLMQRFVARCADLLMANRKVLLGVFVLITLGLGYSATHVRLDPGFNKQIPVRHDYMLNFLEFSRIFTGANRLLVSVNWKGEGDIYNPQFLETLQHVTDDVFFISGVSRPSVTSLFTPNVRYIEITEDGYVGDLVVPPQYAATPRTCSKCAATQLVLAKLAACWPMT